MKRSEVMIKLVFTLHMVQTSRVQTRYMKFENVVG